MSSVGAVVILSLEGGWVETATFWEREFFSKEASCLHLCISGPRFQGRALLEGLLQRLMSQPALKEPGQCAEPRAGLEKYRVALKEVFPCGFVCFHRKFPFASVTQEAVPGTSWGLLASCPEHRVGSQLPGTFEVCSGAAVLRLDPVCAVV